MVQSAITVIMFYQPLRENQVKWTEQRVRNVENDFAVSIVANQLWRLTIKLYVVVTFLTL
jgi:hypothetical protein